MTEFKASIDFGVIGLGRFGMALAEKLAENGKEVLALDTNESKVRHIQEKVEQAFVISQLDKATLIEAGIHNCSTVIVCIGEQVEASILTALNVIEIGVPRVIAKANSTEHGKVLQKIGAEVVYPERDRAIRLADSLSMMGSIDTLNLSSDYMISEFSLGKRHHGKTVSRLGFQKRFNLKMIAIMRECETILDIDPDFVLHANDMVIVIGKKENVAKLQHFL